MRLIHTIILSMLIGGCSTNLTSDGEKVRVVTSEQRTQDCEFMKLVSVQADLGPDKPGSALKKALNETGSLGGNGFFIINNDIHWFDGASVTGEALKCEGI